MPTLERLSDLQIFTAIATGGSLSAAARKLDLSLAVVSARLAGLESTLGVRLIHRSTRRLSLTEEGQEFQRRALRILGEVAELEDLLEGTDNEPHGRLRITATAAFGRRHIAPRIAAFRERYPRITLELQSSDAIVDLVKNGIDLAIRQSALPDSNLKVRSLVPNRRVACASPAYLARHGRPTHPEQFAAHACLTIGDPPLTRWHFTHRQSNEEITIAVHSVFQTNDGEVAHAAALADAGIALKSLIDVADDLRSGALVELCPDWRSPGSPIQAVYPAGRHLAGKVRVFIDFMAEALQAQHLGH